MKLADLRKLAIRKQFRIRFSLQNGLECVIDEKGMAQVPELNSIPQFSIEEELKSAAKFILEPVVPANQKNPPKPRPVGREELAALAMPSPSATAAHAEHDDE